MYSTPELLLVGAAQYLVLGLSEIEWESQPCAGLTQDNIEVDHQHYDDDFGW